MIQVYLTGLKPAAGKTAIEAVILSDIHQTVILQWEQCQGHQAGQCANANKLSGVKHKASDPTSQQQQCSQKL